MYPVLFEIFGFKVHSFGLLMLIAFGTALLLARSRGPRFGFTHEQISDVGFWALIAGVLGARVAFLAQEIPYYLEHPEKLLTLQFEGLTSFGGLLFGFLAVVVACRRMKKPLWNLLDVLAPAMLVGHIIGRIGCLLNGCCYGGHCDLPWAIHVQGEVGLFHPAQVYDSLMNLGALGLLLFMERRGLKAGQTFGWFLVLHGAARFIYEFWRAGTTSTTMGSLPITEAHVAALVLVLAGGIILAKSRRNSDQPQPEAV